MPALVFKGQGTAWYPNSVAKLDGHLNQLFKPIDDISAKRCRGIAKNTAYSIQYLEFLAQIHTDLNLSAVLSTQTWKAFIIHGCAVLEAIFYYVLVSTGRAAHTDWQSKSKVTSPEFKLGGELYRTETEFFTKLAKPVVDRMTFETMCQRVESKKLVQLDNEFYSRLPRLRKLRNRVHIYGIETDSDTDYIKFDRKDYELMKFILKAVLTSHLFPTVDDQLDLKFLEPAA
jgi:hypothetical protein